MGEGVGDPEIDGHYIQEGRLGQGRAQLAEIGPDVEFQVIAADIHLRAGEQRRIATPVGVGQPFGQEPAVAVETHGDAAGRMAMGRIQDVCGQPAHKFTCAIDSAPASLAGSLPES
jgi:hypothetical protein